MSVHLPPVPPPPPTYPRSKCACRTAPRAMPPLVQSNGNRDTGVAPLSAINPDTLYSANEWIAGLAGGSVGVLGTLIQLELKQVGGQVGPRRELRTRGGLWDIRPSTRPFVCLTCRKPATCAPHPTPSSPPAHFGNALHTRGVHRRRSSSLGVIARTAMAAVSWSAPSAVQPGPSRRSFLAPTCTARSPARDARGRSTSSA